MNYKKYLVEKKKSPWKEPQGEQPNWLNTDQYGYNQITPNFPKSDFKITYSAGEGEKGFEIDYGSQRGSHWNIHTVQELVNELKPWLEKTVKDLEKEMAEMKKLGNILNFKGPGGKKLKEMQKYLGG